MVHMTCCDTRHANVADTVGHVCKADNTAELAEANSMYVQRIIREHADLLGYDLLNDARGRWRPPTAAHREGSRRRAARASWS